LAAALGHPARARALERSAEDLRLRFERTFWLEDDGYYALALDGRKQACAVLASNAGHALWAGLCSPERAARTAERLMREDSFSGFGIRTLAASAPRYNPMSYHNGSVWPHDNALIAAGFARYGLTNLAGRILTGLFEAALTLDLHRMPELFCGFRQRPGEGPTRYPLACAPQAWAAGAVTLLLSSSLGMTIDAPARRITFAGAYLPPFLDEVDIEGLHIGADEVDLRLRRCPQDVGIQILRRTGPVEIVSVK
jgi:glycogen debranching enzyme